MLVLKRKKGESIDILDNVDRSKLLYRIYVDQILSVSNKNGDRSSEVVTQIPSFFIVIKRADGKVIGRIVMSRQDCHGVQVSFYVPYELTIGVTRGNNVHVDISIEEPGHFTYIQKTEKLPYEKYNEEVNRGNTNSGDVVRQSPGRRRLGGST